MPPSSSSWALGPRVRSPSIGPRGPAWSRVAHTGPIVRVFFSTWVHAPHHLIWDETWVRAI